MGFGERADGVVLCCAVLYLAAPLTVFALLGRLKVQGLRFCTRKSFLVLFACFGFGEELGLRLGGLVLLSGCHEEASDGSLVLLSLTFPSNLRFY